MRQKISIDAKGAEKVGSYQVLLVHNDFAQVCCLTTCFRDILFLKCTIVLSRTKQRRRILSRVDYHW